MAFNSFFRVILSQTFMVSSSQSHILADLANRVLDGTLPTDTFKSYSQDFLTTTNILSTATTFEEYADSSNYDNVPLLTDEGVLIFPIVGVIMKNDGLCGTVGTSTMRTWLSQASLDTRVKKVLFYVDSGGGQVSGTWEFAQDIANFNKPKDAFVDGYCCSGAYYLMCSCDHIYSSSPDNLFGSIGVAYYYKDRTAQLASMGINDRYIYAATSPDKHGDHKALMQGNEAVLQENQLNPTDKTFMEFVAKNRPQVSQPALAGLEVVASKALEDNTGLLDGIDSFDNVYNNLVKIKSPKNNNNSMDKVKLLVDKGTSTVLAKLIPSVTVLTPEDEAEELKQAQASIVTLTSDKETLTASISEKAQKIGELEASIQDAQVKVKEKDSRIVALESVLQEKDSKITELENQLKTFTKPEGKEPVLGVGNKVNPVAGELNTKPVFVKKEIDMSKISLVD